MIRSDLAGAYFSVPFVLEFATYKTHIPPTKKYKKARFQTSDLRIIALKMIMKRAGNKNDQSERMPFLDTFWSLSDEDPKVRAKAGFDMLVHCFPFVEFEGVSDEKCDLEIKDAEYALKRLLKGVCSGRAAARQGFASALSSYLTAAYSKKGRAYNCMERIMKANQNVKSAGNTGDDITDNTSDQTHAWLRSELLRLTDSSSSEEKGRKREIEERDNAFGRLFGILAVGRSGCLKYAPDEVRY